MEDIWFSKQVLFILNEMKILEHFEVINAHTLAISTALQVLVLPDGCIAYNKGITYSLTTTIGVYKLCLISKGKSQMLQLHLFTQSTSLYPTLQCLMCGYHPKALAFPRRAFGTMG